MVLNSAVHESSPQCPATSLTQAPISLLHLPQAGDCVAFKTAPAFVDSVWEVFGPLLAGVPLVAVPRSVGRDPGEVGGVVECVSWADCRPWCVLCLWRGMRVGQAA